MGDNLDFIPSKASALKKSEVNFEAVVYESYKKKKSENSVMRNLEKPITNDKKDGGELNMRHTKNEIVKLAMSGLDPEQKEQAKINLLVKLGAKPPKNKNKNYKQLQIERKKSKEEESKRESFLQLGKNKVGKSTAKGKSFDKKRKKNKGDNILSIYGKIQVSFIIIIVYYNNKFLIFTENHKELSRMNTMKYYLHLIYF
ncbi:unnamed protein product [Phyllotreta striolata]|uniref:Uncharacterized protein n=1 Tax=Phyllotreta striolata TaxID=444603 RepID=A0A9N9TY50_PHYSR|nr:unnamed protein product [Phyllotreta striolata]